MQKGEKTYILFIVFLVFGIIISMQFQSILTEKRNKASDELDVEKLRALLNEEIDTGNKLKSLIDEEIKKRDAYLKSFVEIKNDIDLMLQKKDLDIAKLKAGLVDVKGPGIIIRLDDAPARKNVDIRVLIIHDYDIVQIMNELRKAGAQALSINGERIMATSEQVCAGPTIRVNKNRYAVPYEIKAIGDPELMRESLEKSATVALMIRDGIRVKIETSKSIVIPKFKNDPESLVTGLEVVE